MANSMKKKLLPMLLLTLQLLYIQLGVSKAYILDPPYLPPRTPRLPPISPPVFADCCFDFAGLRVCSSPNPKPSVPTDLCHKTCGNTTTCVSGLLDESLVPLPRPIPYPLDCHCFCHKGIRMCINPPFIRAFMKCFYPKDCRFLVCYGRCKPYEELP